MKILVFGERRKADTLGKNFSEQSREHGQQTQSTHSECRVLIQTKTRMTEGECSHPAPTLLIVCCCVV